MGQSTLPPPPLNGQCPLIHTKIIYRLPLRILRFFEKYYKCSFKTSVYKMRLLVPCSFRNSLSELKSIHRCYRVFVREKFNDFLIVFKGIPSVWDCRRSHTLHYVLFISRKEGCKRFGIYFFAKILSLRIVFLHLICSCHIFYARRTYPSLYGLHRYVEAAQMILIEAICAN